MAPRAIPDSDGRAALESYRASGWSALDRATQALLVRFLLQRLAERAPGKSVEVRVPPWGAVQCIPGLQHTRGTPPNVVELAPEKWVALATGALAWDRAVGDGAVVASGTRADEVAGLLPLTR